MPCMPAVVAGNRWDGWLSEVKDPVLSHESISPLSCRLAFLFHLPPLVSGDNTGDPNLPYPMILTLREWRFSHDHDRIRNWKNRLLQLQRLDEEEDEIKRKLEGLQHSKDRPSTCSEKGSGH
ncbi:hypothetical protein CC80DRAFT_597891 [Byssothecium circinans]|uniref:Uncharacterized protein n=1 Tax=Byssothecium circinans TaxID=147558 RepID=A0A6A5TGC8_9PLEO|nr:hypothetical protein CC80DRAFT_597891 [Byssothecium circinans]